MTRRILLLCLALALLLPATAAAGVKIELRFERPDPAPELRGDLLVTFEDRREPDKGGEEPELVGQVRNGYGIPFGVFARGPQLDRLVPAMVADALRAEGIRAKPGEVAGGQARLHVRLDAFWCDGSTRYEMWMAGDVSYFPPGAQVPTWTAPLDGRGGVTVAWAVKRELPEGYARMFAQAIEALRGQLRSEGFRSALGRASSPVAASVERGDSRPVVVEPKPASEGHTFEPHDGYELELQPKSGEKARRMKKAGHRLFSGGAVMFFVPMGVSVIIGGIASSNIDSDMASTAPLTALVPIAGPMLMAVQLNLADGLLPPTLVLGGVFTTLETIGFIMLWAGVDKMASSGRYAARSGARSDRRRAVRDLVIVPTLRPGHGGLAVAGRF